MAAARGKGARPALVAVAGMVASGKSTVARELAGLLGVERLCADELRRQYREHGAREASWPGFSSTVYAELLRRAGEILRSGRGVVLDATFRNRALRAEARALARSAGAAFLLVECRARPETCRARLRAREAAGEPGWLDLFEGFLTLWEPVSELPAGEHAVVDTDGLAPTREALAVVLGEHVLT